MKEIALKKRYAELVDDGDYNWLSRLNWYVIIEPLYKKTYVRNTTNIQFEGKKRKTVTKLMHRMITSAPNGMHVDPIDGNGLNNQRHNLRVCTREQNALNRKPKKNSITGVKGVCKSSENNYRVRITVSGVVHSIGCFPTLTIAAEEYDKAALVLHGEFARLNNLGVAV